MHSQAILFFQNDSQTDSSMHWNIESQNTENFLMWQKSLRLYRF